MPRSIPKALKMARYNWTAAPTILTNAGEYHTLLPMTKNIFLHHFDINILQCTTVFNNLNNCFTHTLLYYTKKALLYYIIYYY